MVSRCCSRWYPLGSSIREVGRESPPGHSRRVRRVRSYGNVPEIGPGISWRTLPVSAIVASRTDSPTIRGVLITTHEVRINDRIRAREVFLVGPEGEQLGVKPLPEALSYSRQLELDLVEVAPNANPPVCRVMDYGRYLYEQEQRRRQSKRKATNVVIKEMKFRPKIDEHDYVTKMKHVVRFLGEGNKVKLTIMFRGREMAHPELGMRILNRVAEDVAEVAIVESAPRQDGRNMTMVLHPIRKDGRKPKADGGEPRQRRTEEQKAQAPPGSEPVATEPQEPVSEVQEPVLEPEADKVAVSEAAAPIENSGAA
jgi:translation initiation factor IF-3